MIIRLLLFIFCGIPSIIKVLKPKLADDKIIANEMELEPVIAAIAIKYLMF